MARPRKYHGCSEPGCSEPHHARGRCSKHYFDAWRAAQGKRVGCGAGRPKNLKTCIEPGCTELQVSRGRCRPHYRKWKWAQECIPTLAAKRGLSPIEYMALGSTCQICGAHGSDRMLDLDHCHETDKVRGLLCRRCNIGLGYFRDRPDLLAAAIEYLAR